MIAHLAATGPVASAKLAGPVASAKLADEVADGVGEQSPAMAAFTSLFAQASFDNAPAMATRLLEAISKLCEDNAHLQAERERMEVELDELVRHRRFPCRLLRCRPHRHLLRHHLLHRHLSRHPAAPPSLPPSLPPYLTSLTSLPLLPPSFPPSPPLPNLVCRRQRAGLVNR
jgi:hypothetical protein